MDDVQANSFYSARSTYIIFLIVFCPMYIVPFIIVWKNPSEIWEALLVLLMGVFFYVWTTHHKLVLQDGSIYHWSLFSRRRISVQDLIEVGYTGAPAPKMIFEFDDSQNNYALVLKPFALKDLSKLIKFIKENNSSIDVDSRLKRFEQ